MDLVAAVIVAACGSSVPSSPAPISSEPSGPTGHAEASRGRYRLTLDMPSTTWAPGQPIEATASLAVDAPAPVDIGRSGGGLIITSLAEVGGTRGVGGAQTADCAADRLIPGQPVRAILTKSGGWSDGDPNAAFAREFLADPVYRLPAGVWDITVIASFVEGAGCSGEPVNLQTTLRIVVHG